MGFFDMFKQIASGPAPTIAKDAVDGLTVSTIDSVDMGPETAIIDKNGAHPVERYATKAAALKGHAEWLKRVVGLNEVVRLGYGDLVDARTIELRRSK